MALKITGRYDLTMTKQRQRIVWVAGLGLFLATLDTGIINVALPTLQASWHTTSAIMAWTVSAYTVMLAGTVLLWGRLADRIGPARVFWWGLIGFVATSSACGASPTLDALIMMRALQGLASAMIQGTAIALATADLPLSQRCVATGTLAMLQGLGPVVGPTVGGILLTWFSWRTLFWINLPLTIPLIAVLRKDVALRTKHHPVQPLGLFGQGSVFVMVSLGLASLTVNGTPRLICLIAAGLALIGTIRSERSASTSVIPHTLWVSRTFWALAVAIMIVGGTTALVFMIPPYLLPLWGHHAPWQIGLLNMSAPLMLVAFSRPFSQLLNRYSATRLMLKGLALMATALTVIAFTINTHSVALLVLCLGAYGVGAAAFFPANLTRLLALTPPEVYGVTGAIQRMAINLGTATDAAVVGMLLLHHSTAGSIASSDGIRVSWMFGVFTLLLAMVGLLGSSKTLVCNPQ